MTKAEASLIFRGFNCEPYISNHATGWRVFIDGQFRGHYCEIDIRIRHGAEPRLFFQGVQLPVAPAQFATVIGPLIEGLD